MDIQNATWYPYAIRCNSVMVDIESSNWGIHKWLACSNHIQIADNHSTAVDISDIDLHVISAVFSHIVSSRSRAQTIQIFWLFRFWQESF